MSNEYMAKLREKAEKCHPYEITAPKNEKGRYQTYYRDDTGKRKIIRAKTREALLDKLVSIYFTNSHLEKLTFYDCFRQWLGYKKSLMASSPNTLLRYEQVYHRHLEPSQIHSMPLKKIDVLTLEAECNRIVRNEGGGAPLTKKAWNNVKTVLNGVYDYAMRKHYITENPLLQVRIEVKFRQVNRKMSSVRTFNTDECASLSQYLDECYAGTGDTSFLAVKLNLFLGLRVGELVSLKWSDLINDRYLHIVREEVRNQTDGLHRFSVVEHTKTGRDRVVVVIPKALEIFREVRENGERGEFVFMRGGERITSIRIHSVLRKYASHMGVPLKSSHTLRRTYASNLNAAGVPLDCIREMLGHTSLNTTLGYLYNPLPEEATFDLISKAL